MTGMLASGDYTDNPLGTPSYCTVARTSPSRAVDTYNTPKLVSGQLYCGIGGQRKHPVHLDGHDHLGGGGSGCYGSFVAGSINVGGGTTLNACGYRLTRFNSSTGTAKAPLSTADYPLDHEQPLAQAIRGI